MLTVEQKIFFIQFLILYFFVAIPLVLLFLLFLEKRENFPHKLRNMPISLKFVDNIDLDETPKLLNQELSQVEIEPTLNENERIIIEKKAMDFVKSYELKQGCHTEDVSMYYTGYDIKSTDGNGNIKMIEVKGKAIVGKVTLTVNEWNTAKSFGDSYYLYIVENLFRGETRLRIIQNPYNKLVADENRFQYILKRDKYTSLAKEVRVIN